MSARHGLFACSLAAFIAVSFLSALIVPHVARAEPGGSICPQNKDAQGNFVFLNRQCPDAPNGTCRLVQGGGGLTCQLNQQTNPTPITDARGNTVQGQPGTPQTPPPTSEEARKRLREAEARLDVELMAETRDAQANARIENLYQEVRERRNQLTDVQALEYIANNPTGLATPPEWNDTNKALINERLNASQLRINTLTQEIARLTPPQATLDVPGGEPGPGQLGPSGQTTGFVGSVPHDATTDEPSTPEQLRAVARETQRYLDALRRGATELADNIAANFGTGTCNSGTVGCYCTTGGCALTDYNARQPEIDNYILRRQELEAQLGVLATECGQGSTQARCRRATLRAQELRVSADTAARLAGAAPVEQTLERAEQLLRGDLRGIFRGTGAVNAQTAAAELMALDRRYQELQNMFATTDMTIDDYRSNLALIDAERRAVLERAMPLLDGVVDVGGHLYRIDDGSMPRDMLDRTFMSELANARRDLAYLDSLTERQVAQAASQFAYENTLARVYSDQTETNVQLAQRTARELALLNARFESIINNAPLNYSGDPILTPEQRLEVAQILAQARVLSMANTMAVAAAIDELDNAFMNRLDAGDPAARQALGEDSRDIAGSILRGRADEARADLAEQLASRERVLATRYIPDGRCLPVCDFVTENGRQVERSDFLRRVDAQISYLRQQIASLDRVADAFLNRSPVATVQAAEMFLLGTDRASLIYTHIDRYEEARLGGHMMSPLSGGMPEMGMTANDGTLIHSAQGTLDFHMRAVERLSSGEAFTPAERRLIDLARTPWNISPSERTREYMADYLHERSVRSWGEMLNPMRWIGSTAEALNTAWNSVMNPTFAMQAERIFMTPEQILGRQALDIGRAALDVALWTPQAGRLIAMGLEGIGRGVGAYLPNTAITSLRAFGDDMRTVMGNFLAPEGSFRALWWESGGVFDWRFGSAPHPDDVLRGTAGLGPDGPAPGVSTPSEPLAQGPFAGSADRLSRPPDLFNPDMPPGLSPGQQAMWRTMTDEAVPRAYIDRPLSSFTAEELAAIRTEAYRNFITRLEGSPSLLGRLGGEDVLTALRTQAGDLGPLAGAPDPFPPTGPSGPGPLTDAGPVVGPSGSRGITPLTPIASGEVRLFTQLNDAIAGNAAGGLTVAGATRALEEAGFSLSGSNFVRTDTGAIVATPLENGTYLVRALPEPTIVSPGPNGPLTTTGPGAVGPQPPTVPPTLQPPPQTVEAPRPPQAPRTLTDALRGVQNFGPSLFAPPGVGGLSSLAQSLARLGNPGGGQGIFGAIAQPRPPAVFAQPPRVPGAVGTPPPVAGGTTPGAGAPVAGVQSPVRISFESVRNMITGYGVPSSIVSDALAREAGGAVSAAPRGGTQAVDPRVATLTERQAVQLFREAESVVLRLGSNLDDLAARAGNSPTAAQTLEMARLEAQMRAASALQQQAVDRLVSLGQSGPGPFGQLTSSRAREWWQIRAERIRADEAFRTTLDARYRSEVRLARLERADNGSAATQNAIAAERALYGELDAALSRLNTRQAFELIDHEGAALSRLASENTVQRFVRDVRETLASIFPQRSPAPAAPSASPVFPARNISVASSDRSALFTATADDGRHLGNLSLSRMDGPQPYQVLHMAVEPGSQGLGVGRALLQQADDFLLQKGLTAFASDTIDPLLNPQAVGFYGRNGWAEVPGYPGLYVNNAGRLAEGQIQSIAGTFDRMPRSTAFGPHVPSGGVTAGQTLSSAAASVRNTPLLARLMRATGLTRTVGAAIIGTGLGLGVVPHAIPGLSSTAIAQTVKATPKVPPKTVSPEQLAADAGKGLKHDIPFGAEFKMTLDGLLGQRGWTPSGNFAHYAGRDPRVAAILQGRTGVRFDAEGWLPQGEIAPGVRVVKLEWADRPNKGVLRSDNRYLVMHDFGTKGTVDAVRVIQSHMNSGRGSGVYVNFYIDTPRVDALGRSTVTIYQIAPVSEYSIHAGQWASAGPGVETGLVWGQPPQPLQVAAGAVIADAVGAWRPTAKVVNHQPGEAQIMAEVLQHRESLLPGFTHRVAETTLETRAKLIAQSVTGQLQGYTGTMQRILSDPTLIERTPSGASVNVAMPLYRQTERQLQALRAAIAQAGGIEQHALALLQKNGLGGTTYATNLAAAIADGTVLTKFAELRTAVPRTVLADAGLPKTTAVPKAEVPPVIQPEVKGPGLAEQAALQARFTEGVRDAIRTFGQRGHLKSTDVPVPTITRDTVLIRRGTGADVTTFTVRLEPGRPGVYQLVDNSNGRVIDSTAPPAPTVQNPIALEGGVAPPTDQGVLLRTPTYTFDITVTGFENLKLQPSVGPTVTFNVSGIGGAPKGPPTTLAGESTALQTSIADLTRQIELARLSASDAQKAIDAAKASARSLTASSRTINGHITDLTAIGNKMKAASDLETLRTEFSLARTQGDRLMRALGALRDNPLISAGSRTEIGRLLELSGIQAKMEARITAFEALPTVNPFGSGPSKNSTQNIFRSDLTALGSQLAAGLNDVKKLLGAIQREISGAQSTATAQLTAAQRQIADLNLQLQTTQARLATVRTQIAEAEAASAAPKTTSVPEPKIAMRPPVVEEPPPTITKLPKAVEEAPPRPVSARADQGPLDELFSGPGPLAGRPTDLVPPNPIPLPPPIFPPFVPVRSTRLGSAGEAAPRDVDSLLASAGDLERQIASNAENITNMQRQIVDAQTAFSNLERMSANLETIQRLLGDVDAARVVAERTVSTGSRLSPVDLAVLDSGQRAASEIATLLRRVTLNPSYAGLDGPALGALAQRMSRYSGELRALTAPEGPQISFLSNRPSSYGTTLMNDVSTFVDRVGPKIAAPRSFAASTIERSSMSVDALRQIGRELEEELRSVQGQLAEAGAAPRPAGVTEEIIPRAESTFTGPGADDVNTALGFQERARTLADRIEAAEAGTNIAGSLPTIAEVEALAAEVRALASLPGSGPYLQGAANSLQSAAAHMAGRVPEGTLLDPAFHLRNAETSLSFHTGTFAGFGDPLEFPSFFTRDFPGPYTGFAGGAGGTPPPGGFTGTGVSPFEPNPLRPFSMVVNPFVARVLGLMAGTYLLQPTPPQEPSQPDLRIPPLVRLDTVEPDPRLAGALDDRRPPMVGVGADGTSEETTVGADGEPCFSAKFEIIPCPSGPGTPEPPRADTDDDNADPPRSPPEVRPPIRRGTPDVTGTGRADPRRGLGNLSASLFGGGNPMQMLSLLGIMMSPQSQLSCMINPNMCQQTGSGIRVTPSCAPAEKPEASLCENGTWRPTTAPQSSCVTGWQCVPNPSASSTPSFTSTVQSGPASLPTQQSTAGGDASQAYAGYSGDSAGTDDSVPRNVFAGMSVTAAINKMATGGYGISIGTSSVVPIAQAGGSVADLSTLAGGAPTESATAAAALVNATKGTTVSADIPLPALTPADPTTTLVSFLSSLSEFLATFVTATAANSTTAVSADLGTVTTPVTPIATPVSTEPYAVVRFLQGVASFLQNLLR